MYDLSVINVMSELRIPNGLEAGGGILDAALDPIMRAISTFNELSGAVLKKRHVGSRLNLAGFLRVGL